MSYSSVDRKGRLTLPKEVRASLGLRAGGFVLVERTVRGTYELAPAERVPSDQRWFEHSQMQRRIGKAEADLAEGRSVVTRTVAEAQALLDSFKRKGRRARR